MMTKRRFGISSAVFIFCVFLGSGTAGAHGKNRARLTEIRHSSSHGHSRVTLVLSGEVSFKTYVLKGNAAKRLPPRIYVDLVGARLAMSSRQPIAVQGGPLQQVRVGQFSPDVVRVVLDMESLTEHKTFMLSDPYRVVIDVGVPREARHVAAPKKEKAPTSQSRGERAAANGFRKVVIDPAHGGKDPGALGVGGIAEKEIALSIARRLAAKLRKEMGVEVVLTREDDSFVPLEDRTAVANRENADLFISLHANASPNPRAVGIETYYLDNTDDEASIRLAERENATSRKSITDLQFILSDLIQNSKLEESITLAHHIQSSLVSHVGRRYGPVKDLGVKKALFYVLVGARMPSILVELGFITNRREGRALTRPAYQEAIAEGLYQGIKKYRDTAVLVKNL